MKKVTFKVWMKNKYYKEEFHEDNVKGFKKEIEENAGTIKGTATVEDVGDFKEPKGDKFFLEVTPEAVEKALLDTYDEYMPNYMFKLSDMFIARFLEKMGYKQEPKETKK